MSAEKLVEKEFPLYIPSELIAVIGEITIRFGQLERFLISVLAEAQSESPDELYKKLGEIKGERASNLIKEIKSKLPWIDSDKLKNLQNERNGIMHDAIMQEENGTYIWQANNNDREHKIIHIAELIKLRDEVTEFLFSLLEISERQN